MSEEFEKDLRRTVGEASMANLGIAMQTILPEYTADPTNDNAGKLRLLLHVMSQRLVLETEGSEELDTQLKRADEAQALLDDKEEDQSIADMLDEALGE